MKKIRSLFVTHVLQILSICFLCKASVINIYDKANYGDAENLYAYEQNIDDEIARFYNKMLGADKCGPPPERNSKSSHFDREFILSKRPVQDLHWKSPLGLGQVSGVSIDHMGRPVIFHRGDRTWNYDTFDENFQFTKVMEGPIPVNTVLTLNPETGQVENGWGKDIFYLPHGIHVDFWGNIWLTDVAMHQVFKFPKREKNGINNSEPSLVLGERFVPGDDPLHFCQPTSVAVMQSGEIVVADGYCNDRIIIFDPTGRPMVSVPPRGNEGYFNLRVPHSLTILKRGDICTADREHQRIVCFNLTLAMEQHADGRKEETISWLPLVIEPPGVCRIFGITSYDNLLYAVNGPPVQKDRVQGFTISPNHGSIINTWGPQYDYFTNPHAIAANPNGSALYVTEIGPNIVWKFRLVSNWKLLGMM